MAQLLVQRKQIAERIPPRYGHVLHRNMVAPGERTARPMCYDCKDIQPQIMSFIQATRLRKGHLIKVGNDLFRILELHHLTPGNTRAHIQVRMRNIRSLALADHKFRAEEDVERASLDEREMQYLYSDGDAYYFMDTTTFEQIHISAEALGDSKDYLIAEMTIRVEFYDVEPVGIELPPTVDLLVKETVPGIKGATASNQIKPATLETGLVIQVPPFVNEGDRVRVNTETGEYQSRA
jgi:elongation factor P